MPFEFGDIVLAPFPFTNQTAFKQRPAVIVSNQAYNRARPDVVNGCHQPATIRYRFE